jgi:SPP1 family predicted phage head-tail adaptor
MSKSNKTKIAELDRLVVIESKTTTLDAFGAEISTWTPYAVVWAKRRSRPAREFFTAGRVVREEDVFYMMRYREDIDTTMRLVDNGVPYDIHEIRLGDERNRWMELRVWKAS